MICDDIRIALSEGEVCEETDDRGARIFTHCLYPSFEPVAVYVARKGDGYVVTDGGGASASAYLHGREELGKVLLRECARFGVDCKEDTVVADVVSADWLRAAILAVANASAAAATSALERVAVAAERVLADKIYEGLYDALSDDVVAQLRTVGGDFAEAQDGLLGHHGVRTGQQPDEADHGTSAHHRLGLVRRTRGNDDQCPRRFTLQTGTEMKRKGN